MFSLTTIFGKQAMSASPPRDSTDLQETRSASIDIDDIIDEYDGESEPPSLIGEAGGDTCTYFSLSKVLDNDTISFHTALQDGFSISRFGSNSLLGREINWSNTECDRMLELKDFEVSWSDVNYKIPLTSTITKFRNACNEVLEDINRTALSWVRFSKRLECSPKDSSDDFITILNNIGGSFKSSELTGIIGPSGSGKTSLLNFIARRREIGYSGCLDLIPGDRPLRISAIPQNHHLPEYLTVRENLRIASKLNNPTDVCDHEKQILEVVDLLNLKSCLDTRVNKISGGQSKRVAIAQELLSRADILILDEPTSGLDSMTCFRTLSVLKALISSSRQKHIKPIAIVLTIHQPEHQAFELFDKIYVMAHGGEVIYEGLPNKCVDYVKKYAGLDLPNEDYDPASFMIEIASREYGDEVIRLLSRQVKLDSQSRCNKQEIYSIEPLNIERNSEKDEFRVEYPHLETSKKQHYGANSKNMLRVNPKLLKGDSSAEGHTYKRILILLKRNWLLLYRDPKQLTARILLYILFPLSIGYITGTATGEVNACPNYKQNFDLKELIEDGSQTSSHIQDELGLSYENLSSYFVLIYTMVTSTIAFGTLMFTTEMQSSLKEYQNGWYSIESYLIAYIITSLPLHFLLPPVAVGLFHIVTGQNPGGGNVSDAYRVYLTSMGLIMGSISGELVSMIFGTIYIGHVATALFVSQGATLPFVILSGFAIRLKDTTKFIQFISWASLYRHVVNIAMIARYGFSVCPCDQDKFNKNGPDIVGVPERLRNFLKYMMDTQEGPVEDSNSTREQSDDDSDLFKLVAKQVSYFNTFGTNIERCDQVVPFQMIEARLSDEDLVTSFTALFIIAIALTILLFITVKLVIRHKKSL